MVPEAGAQLVRSWPGDRCTTNVWFRATFAGAPYGPLGNPHRVVKNLSLRAADVEHRVPLASTEAIGVDPDDDSLQRAEALLPH